MSRSENRHYEAKAKARAKHVVSNVWRMSKDASPKRIGRLAATPKPCSCPMCGHRRDTDGPSASEIRAIQCVNPIPGE